MHAERRPRVTHVNTLLSIITLQNIIPDVGNEIRKGQFHIVLCICDYSNEFSALYYYILCLTYFKQYNGFITLLESCLMHIS